MSNCAKACSEMNYIIQNLDEKFSNKIPDRIRKFFENNKDENYKVDLDPKKPLYEQNILPETEMYMQIVHKLFIASKSEKDQYIADSRKAFVNKKSDEYLKLKEKEDKNTNELQGEKYER